MIINYEIRSKHDIFPNAIIKIMKQYLTRIKIINNILHTQDTQNSDADCLSLYHFCLFHAFFLFAVIMVVLCRGQVGN